MKSKQIPRLMLSIALFITIVQSLIIQDWTFTLSLLLLIPIPFLQNMAFTWVSRSRQGGDPDYHRYAAWSSNFVWILTQSFIASNVYTPITHMMDSGINIQSIVKIILTFVVYAIATSEGSVMMMKINLGKVKVPTFLNFLIEKGKRQVGKR